VYMETGHATWRGSQCKAADVQTCVCERLQTRPDIFDGKAATALDRRDDQIEIDDIGIFGIGIFITHLGTEGFMSFGRSGQGMERHVTQCGYG